MVILSIIPQNIRFFLSTLSKSAQTVAIN